MSDNEPRYTSPESDIIPQLRFETGWREILEAPDTLNYQTWIDDLVNLSLQQMNDEAERVRSPERVLSAWLRALEHVADIAITSEDMKEMTQAEIVETALIALRTTIEAMGWDTEGLVFTVPNLFTAEEATIDIRKLVD